MGKTLSKIPCKNNSQNNQPKSSGCNTVLWKSRVNHLTGVKYCMKTVVEAIPIRFIVNNLKCRHQGEMVYQALKTKHGQNLSLFVIFNTQYVQMFVIGTTQCTPRFQLIIQLLYCTYYLSCNNNVETSCMPQKTSKILMKYGWEKKRDSKSIRKIKKIFWQESCKI